MKQLRPCGVEGCVRSIDVHGSHGMCAMHAIRVRRYGDPHYITPESLRVARLREAQPTLGRLKPTTYKKLMGRHEHRTIMEIKLCRALRKGEIVHHIDGNRHNNCPENLEVMTQSEHARLHKEQEYHWHEHRA